MESLLKFKEFYEEITATTKKLEKAAILEKYKDDEDIKFYLNYLLNPYITTGISDKKAYARFHHDGCIDVYPNNIFNSTKDALNYLQQHNTGKYEDIELMFAYYMSLTLKLLKANILGSEFQLTKELFYKIMTKNLPMGIDVKSVNKVIPNLIPTFNVMLANKYFDKPEIALNKKFALTTKIDGGRIIAIKKNGEAKFYTRQGQEYIGLVDLKAEMEKYMPDGVCLDGELVAIDTTKEDTYKNTMKISRTKDIEKHGLKMIVFDCMTAEQFETQSCPDKYYERMIHLGNLFRPWWTIYYVHKSLRGEGSKRTWDWQFHMYQCGGQYYGDEYKFKFFERLPLLYLGDDVNKITEILNEQIAKGEEGIMINFVDQPYVFDRTNALLKVKKMKDLDLECIGFEEGTNRHAGRLGALLVNYDGYTVKVGSGFSDELRTEIWNNRDEWLGRTIVVQYFEETYNANDGKSLRFPVYIDYREDK